MLIRREKWHCPDLLAKQYQYIKGTGKLQGSFKEWYNNGILKLQCFYDKLGRLDGAHREWDRNGVLLKCRIYRNGKLHGTWTEWVNWCNSEHQMTKQIEYRNGKRNGEYKSWNCMDGQLRIHCYFVNNKRHGEFKSWFGEINNKLRIHCFYINDKQNGKYTSWSVDHIQMTKTYKVDDENHGLLCHYDSNMITSCYLMEHGFVVATIIKEKIMDVFDLKK